MTASGKQVYIVMGGSGSYSDRSESILGVFSCKESAEKYVAEEEAFNNFVESFRSAQHQNNPHNKQAPVFFDGPEWGYSNFKKSLHGKNDSNADWLVKLAENQKGLERRREVNNAWHKRRQTWTEDFWKTIYNSNPQWQSRLVDDTGTKILWGQESYWIVEETVDGLLLPKSP